MRRSMKRELNMGKYRRFREDVIRRDKYMCAKCMACALIEPDVELRVHLLDNEGPDERYISDMDNAVTLCKYCHDFKYMGSFHAAYGERNNSREQYETWLNSHY